MQYTPKLIASRLLELAHKSSDYYQITDSLPNDCTLDFKAPDSMRVIVNGKTKGYISPCEPLVSPLDSFVAVPAASWKYIDSEGTRMGLRSDAKHASPGDFA